MTMARQTHTLWGCICTSPSAGPNAPTATSTPSPGRRIAWTPTRHTGRHLIEVAPQAAQHLVDTVYFGGGTPAIWGEAAGEAAESREEALPHRPHAGDHAGGQPRQRRGLEGPAGAAAGFNRISLGVQSTDDVCLRALGRIHTWQQVQEAGRLPEAKFPDVSLDLIYGLPGRPWSSGKKTLSDALTLQPEHLSCYGLKLEEERPSTGSGTV